MPAVARHEQGANRFQVVDIPPLPGKCAVCGYSANERPYIDFGMQLDYYGAVLFCIECIEAAAQVLGYASPRAYDEKIDTIRKLISINEAYVEENNGLRNSLNSLLSSSAPHTVFDESAFVESLHGDEESESESTDSEQRTELSIVATTPTLNEQGADDLIDSIFSDVGTNKRELEL